MKSIKRPLGALMSLIMIFSLLSVIAVAVRAEEIVTDTLTVGDTAATSTAYVDWEAQSDDGHPTILSDAVYAGKSAKNYGGIRIREKSKDSGIVTTSSAGSVRKVTVAWIDSYRNDDRYVAVYASNTAYAAPSDLFNSNTRGTLIETLSYNDATWDDIDGVYYHEVELADDYRYIGFRSTTSALYLAYISIDWEIASVGRTWNWASDYSSATCTFTDDSGSHTENAAVTHEVTKQATYLADGVLTHTASVTYDGVIYRDVRTEAIPRLVFGGACRTSTKTAFCRIPPRAPSFSPGTTGRWAADGTSSPRTPSLTTSRSAGT